MNYTEKYHLPQWEETDRIMRVDFNQMCADMEAGLTGNAAAAAAGVAEAKAAAAEAAKLPYVVGSYTGNGQTQTIELGFRPSFLIISGQRATSSPGGLTYSVVTMTAGNAAARRVELTDTGFTVFTKTEDDLLIPGLHFDGYVYDYIAFK